MQSIASNYAFVSEEEKTGGCRDSVPGGKCPRFTLYIFRLKAARSLRDRLLTYKCSHPPQRGMDSHLTVIFLSMEQFVMLANCYFFSKESKDSAEEQIKTERFHKDGEWAVDG